MKKRLFSALLCLCMVVGIAPTMTITAQAAVWHDYYGSNTYGANVYSNYYKSDNPYFNTGYEGQCTWYCWGRAMERCGINLPSISWADNWGNAQTWFAGAQRSIAAGRTDISVGTVPRANSIGVFSKNDGIGHVLFVEDVQGATVYCSEGNYTPDKINYYKHREGTYGINDTVRYPGKDYEERLVGYIYLGSSTTAPSQNLGDDFYACIKSEVGNVNLENYWGNNVQIATANQSDPRQIWHFIKQSDGSYKIVNLADGCYLDIHDGKYESGANVQTHKDSEGDAKRWKLVSCGRDSESVYKIVSAVGGYRLDVAGASAASGTNVQLFVDNDWRHAQEFKIIKRSSAAGGLAGYLPTDSYARISFKGSYLQTTGNTIYYGDGRGMDVQLTKSAKNDPRQIWHFIRQSEGYYKIVNEYSGWCLDVQSGSASNKSNLWTWHIDGGQSSERWYPIYLPKDQNFRLASGMLYPWTFGGNHITYVVDIPGGNLSEGTSVEIYQQTDGGNQQLVIAREEYTRPSRPAAPTNVQLITGEEKTAVMWKEVPATSPYDSRQYDVIVYDSNSNVVFRGSTANTAFVSNQVLQPGHYEIYVRSVNTKYPSSASNYASGYTNVPADVVLTYSVSLGATEGGIVRGAGIFQADTSVTVTATPQNGYRFVEWRENGAKVSEDASYTFKITKSRELTAVFEEETSPVPTTYIVSVSTEEGGSVTGGGSYEDGSSVTVIVTPNEGYVFKEWTENGSTVSGASASYTFTVIENRQLVAVFEAVETPPAPPEKYTIGVNASPAAGGSVSGGGSFNAGAPVTVTATAKDDYRFKEWQENGNQVSTDASYSFIASENRVITAMFEEIVTTPTTYTIKIDTTSGGTVSGGGSYHDGDTVTVTATPGSGYQFKEWIEGGQTVSTQASYTFTAAANRELTAVFESSDAPAPKLTYTLEVNASPTNGGVITGHGNGTYEAGTSVTVTADAYPGYKFVRWVESGVAVSTDANYSFTMNENRTITAIFESEDPAPKNTYTIGVNASPVEYGTVTGGGDYQEGAPVTITATPNTGYQFKEWQLEGHQISTTASYTFTASADQTFVAIFEKQSDTPKPPTPSTYTISVSSSPAAGGSVSGGGSYQGGASVTVTATANTGYRFTGWTESGSQVSTSSRYTFTVGANRTLVAGFTYTGSSSGNSSGGNHSSSSSDSATTTSIPVSTSGTDSGGMVTTAAPNATIKDNVATSVITTTISNEIIKQAVVNKSNEVVISPIITDITAKAEITIPAGALREIEQKTDASLVISTPIADVRLPNTGLSGLSAGQPISIVTEKAGDVLILSITAGGSPVKVKDGVMLAAPLAHSTPGTVAALVQDDGTHRIIRKSVAGVQTIMVPLEDSAKLVIIDNTKHFADVPAESWAANAVAFASAHELFNGTGVNTFSPDLPMTRGMLAVVLHNLESNPKQAFTEKFSDVAVGAWYTDAVIWAAEHGIVSGYGNGQFGPGNNITREQLAVMLWRYAGSPAATDKELHFTDTGEASSYALEALCWAVENSIIGGYGDGRLDPQGLATRAQVAQMLLNYLKK